MEFRIADTFTDSLARLTGEEQKAVKTTAFDLQLNPVHPGMQLHKLDQARDLHFWSVRVSRDIRLIVHRTDASLLLCYVDHHHEAYRWAERRKWETHPKTGAAQLVEIRETVQEIIVPAYVEAAQLTASKAPLFEHVAEDALLSYGVPTEWLQDVRQANEDTLLTLDHLQREAAEALLELATGGKPSVTQISVFNGPIPTLRVFESPEDESRTVGKWLVDRGAERVMPHEMGVFVRLPAELDRARTAVEPTRLPFTILAERVETTSGYVSISTMHLAKGLEFRAVAVMACDDEILPLQARIETVADDAELQEVYNTERHLLYVACTRARDHLLLTSVDPASEFLDDLRR